MAVTNIEDLNLDEITEEFLREEMIDMGTDLGVDTRQGSLYRDAGEGHVFRTAKYFNDLRQIVSIISIYSSTGEMLDEHLAEHGMSRNPPEDTAATYYVEFIGAYPEEGARMICEDHFFSTSLLDGQWAIVSEETGTAMNDIAPGASVLPERDIQGLKSATVISLAAPALNKESDDDARRRLINSLAGPDENANKSQLRTWCESVEGVGRARIISLWDGPDTALGIIVSTEGRKPTDLVVEAVQEYVDPGAAGMGEGKATIGCHFTAQAVEELAIDVAIHLIKSGTASNMVIQDTITAAIEDYFKTLAFSDIGSGTTVRYAYIFARAMDVDGVVDCPELLINGAEDNISCTTYQVPVLGEVAITYD